MDVWMVAVAAGAGYIAKHFKKYKQDGGQTSSESPFSDSFSGKPESPKPHPDKKWPFRRLSKSENSRKDYSEVRNEVSEGVSTSQFDGEQGVLLGIQEGSYVFSTSSLFPGFVGDDGGLVDVEGMGDLLHKPSTPRSSLVLRSRGKFGQAIKPLSSLESCLMAQLYTERVEMKEYMPSSFDPSSMQNLRPFFVTDGSKVISRASSDAFILQNNIVVKKLQTDSEENNGFSGVPLLPNIKSLDIKGKEKVNTRMEGGRELSHTSTTETTEHLNLSRGSSDATLLCLGMSFGILYSYMAQRQEVEKLNHLLKQTENLVQDLEEELEMKDSLIMQELKSEDHASKRMDGGSSIDGSPRSDSHEHNWEHLTNIDNKQSVIKKAKDDSFSKIEAELEAELEMLEQNMTTSSTLERRISNLVELDPDFEPDVARGELRADILDREANTNQDETGSTTTTHSANYAVSPKELSLRLHEVLQSQLEERIRQLEAEIEGKNHKSWNDFSSSDAGDENPVVEDEPVVLHLSGEALDAYKEACDEFAKLDESDEDSVCCGDGEMELDEDEMEKLLIKHIVEKARQGSPVVLNAQRALFSE